MDLNKVIIIGSGPAGTWAAQALAERGFRPLILDLGDLPGLLKNRPQNFYAEKLQGAHKRKDIFLGDHGESLHNIFHDYLSPKLKSPLMRFITESTHLTPLVKNNFHALTSSALGGLANAWGGHVYRFSTEELQALNLNASDFKKYYDRIGREFPISGSNDCAFSKIIPSEETLCAPLKLDQVWSNIFRKKHLFKKLSEKKLFIGHPRIAINSSEFKYHNLDFFIPTEGDLYSPRFTMEKLIAEKKVDFIGHFLFESYEEKDDQVFVYGKHSKTNERLTFSANKILIACGAINSTRSVLRSENAYNQKLPFLDNPILYIPFINLNFLGMPQETHTYTAQANLMFRDKLFDLYGTFYNLNSIMRSDVLFDFPLPISAAIFSAKTITQGMSILQLWAPGEKSASNHIFLNENNEIEINYSSYNWGKAPGKIIKLLRKLGMYSHPMMIKKIAPGNSYHYAGSLPMSESPTKFQTDLQGRLHGKNHVHIIDSSIFPSLPSKNLTYTIMANAYRIGSNLKL